MILNKKFITVEKNLVMNKSNHIMVLMITILSFISLNNTIAQSDWEFNTSLYGWLAGIDGTVGLIDKEKQINATPGDLLKNLEFTMGGSFEARTSKVNLIADVFYMGLGKEVNVEKTIGENTIKKSGTLDLDEWVVEGTIGYRITEELDLLFANRLYVISAGVIIDDTTASKSVNWFDGFLGARYTKNFGENFYTTLRVDAGGGGSTFSWFANAVIGYHITKLFSLSVNYRILSVDYEKGLNSNYFKYDTFNHGFGFAAVFSF